MLTMPTPRISQSPIFQPRSPITLAKYVQATSPTPSVISTGSLSPVPSLPACDRCCLARLEEGLICRTCERQWLACKMWYQANDGGRRRWLTEPLIRPAESNASLRAVMGVLGVSGNSGSVGLGIEASLRLKKELPFKVIPTPAATDRPGGYTSGATRWRQLRRHSLEATRRTREAVRFIFSLSLMALSSGSSASSPSNDLPDISPATSYDSGATSSWTARIAPHRRPHSSPAAPSYGSSVSGMVCITSSSRFVEHLV